MTPIDLVLSRLDGPRQSKPGQWSAPCPAHTDTQPSLSIAEGDDGRVLMNCHASCSLDAICAALEIQVSDLFASAKVGLPCPPKAAPRPGRTFHSAEAAVRAITAGVQRERGPEWFLVHSYSYADVAGREILRVLRFEPQTGGAKTFRPIHEAAEGWRVGDPPGPLPLYRVNQLPASQLVHVLEGEKAADAASALSVVGTTSAHGASAARKTDWSPLAGKDVVVLPDNDEAGRAYAREVAEILTSLTPPAHVTTVELPGVPEHGDIVEFIAARRAAGLDNAAIRTEIERLVAADSPSGGFGGAQAGPSPESQPPSVGSHGSDQGPSRDSRGEQGPSVGSGGASLPPPPPFGQPEPLPNDLPSVDRFDPWMLPRALFRWIVDIAERIQCPMDFPAVAAMVALAAVLGRKVGIRPKRCDDWLVVANLWGALIGRPGIMKTPPLQEATRPLKRLEIAAKKVFEEAMKTHAAAMMVHEARRKNAEGEIKKSLKKDVDEGYAIREAQELIDAAPELPVRRRYLVNDSTVEKLGEILNQNPNGVQVYRDELVGLLRNLDKDGQESARAFYLEAWNGTGRFTYDRIGRGTVDIEATIVSILGSIQPGPLGRYLRDAVDGGLGDDGLMSRFQLAVWPDQSSEWQNVDRWPDAEAKNLAYDVFTHLDRLTPENVGAEKSADDEDAIPFLRFDVRAQPVFDRWRAGLERRLRSGEEHPALESHFSKYRSLIPSVSLLIHLADGGNGPIGVEPLRKAIAWGRYLSSHARRIYAVAVADDFAAAKRLVARIRKGDVKDGFTERDVYKNDWSGLDRDAVHKAVTVLVEYGWVATQPVQTDGRSKTTIRINPRVMEGRPCPADKAGASHSDNPQEPQEGTDGTDGSAVAAGSTTSDSSEALRKPTDKTDRSPGGWDRV